MLLLYEPLALQGLTLLLRLLFLLSPSLVVHPHQLLTYLQHAGLGDFNTWAKEKVRFCRLKNTSRSGRRRKTHQLACCCLWFWGGRSAECWSWWRQPPRWTRASKRAAGRRTACGTDATECPSYTPGPLRPFYTSRSYNKHARVRFSNLSGTILRRLVTHQLAWLHFLKENMNWFSQLSLASSGATWRQ